MPDSKRFTPPPVEDPGSLLVIEEVCRLTGYSIESMYRNRTRGLSPGNLAIRWRGRLYWRASDIDNWLTERVDVDFNQRWQERRHKRSAAPITEARRIANSRKRASTPEIMEWLSGVLSEGPVLRAEVLALAQRKRYDERAVDRAARFLKVQSVRSEVEHGRPATWSLPETADA